MPQLRKPTEVKKILGNPSKEAKSALENKPEFKRSKNDVFSPIDLKGLEVEKWNELAPILNDAGIFTSGDRELLAKFCRLWPAYIGAIDDLRKFGAYREQGRERELVIAPWMNLLLKLEPQMIGILAKLGMSPVDRSRVNTVAKDTSTDPADRFFN